MDLCKSCDILDFQNSRLDTDKLLQFFVPSFLRTDFTAKSWLSKSKDNISTTTSSITTIDTLLERSFYCASNRKSTAWNLLKRVSYIVLSKESQGLWIPRESRLFLACEAATKIVLWRVDSLSSCRHLLYTFRDVSSYHSNTVSDVAVATHACRSLGLENRHKSKCWVTSNGSRDIISWPIFKTKISMFRSWRDLSNDILFVEFRWEVVTQ